MCLYMESCELQVTIALENVCWSLVRNITFTKLIEHQYFIAGLCIFSSVQTLAGFKRLDFLALPLPNSVKLAVYNLKSSVNIAYLSGTNKFTSIVRCNVLEVQACY